MLLIGIYPEDILGEIKVVRPCTKQLDHILPEVGVQWGLFQIKRDMTTKCNAKP